MPKIEMRTCADLSASRSPMAGQWSIAPEIITYTYRPVVNSSCDNHLHINAEHKWKASKQNKNVDKGKKDKFSYPNKSSPVYAPKHKQMPEQLSNKHVSDSTQTWGSSLNSGVQYRHSILHKATGAYAHA